MVLAAGWGVWADRPFLKGVGLVADVVVIGSAVDDLLATSGINLLHCIPSVGQNSKGVVEP